MEVQVVEYRRELDAAVDHFLDRKRSIASLAQIGFERFTRKKVHHKIPVTVFDEVIVDARKVGMNQACQEKHLALAGFNQRVLRALGILAYFLKGYHSVA